MSTRIVPPNIMNLRCLEKYFIAKLRQIRSGANICNRAWARAEIRPPNLVILSKFHLRILYRVHFVEVFGVSRRRDRIKTPSTSSNIYKLKFSV